VNVVVLVDVFVFVDVEVVPNVMKFDEVLVDVPVDVVVLVEALEDKRPNFPYANEANSG
jgi:hypothetical protein